MSKTRSAINGALVLVVAIVCGACECAEIPGTSDLPAVFEANRVFVEPILTSGDTLRFLTDTGGIGFLSGDVADDLSLTKTATLLLPDSITLETARLPQYVHHASIPIVPVRNDPFTRALQGRMRVLDYDPWGELKDEMVGDGMLGHEWFSGRVWLIDYFARRFAIVTSADDVPEQSEHVAKLGFPLDSSGHRTWHWPSIEAEIDGEVIPFLLDTGATVVCDSSALAILGDDAPMVRGASFLAGSLFDHLAQTHPDWRIIEGAERGGIGAMLEVPFVTVADHSVGPVWFSRRTDASFHGYMSQRMDRRVEGALGGSLFRYFRLIIDYPNAIAVFERTGEFATSN